MNENLLEQDSLARHCGGCGVRLMPSTPESECPRCALQLGVRLFVDQQEVSQGTEAELAGGVLPLRYLGDYELLELLAEGAMGQVYLARQADVNREIAVKVLHRSYLASPRALRRFRNEVEIVASLNHPNVLPIFEAGEDGGIHFFSMQLAGGGSLAQALARGEWKPGEGKGERERQRRAAEFMATVARAVHHAHQRGVIHRDLKPGNILLDAGGEPMVGDFGLSKAVDSKESLTLSREVLGTLAYMAPEQARAGSLATTSSDIYSLGVILYEMLCGRLPFSPSNLTTLLEEVQWQQPKPPSYHQPSLGGDLSTICLKCLEKEPSRRYASPLELAEDLERWLTGEPIVARPSSVWERAIKWCRRHPAAAVLGCVLVLSVLGGSGAVRLAQKLEEATFRQGKTLGQTHMEKANSLLGSNATLDAVHLLGKQVAEGPDYYPAITRLIQLLTRRNFLLPVSQAGPLAGPAQAVHWHPDGKHLLVLSYQSDGTNQDLTLWDAFSGGRVAARTGLGALRGHVLFSADGQRLATSVGGRFRLWHAMTLEESGELALTNQPSSLAWHPKNRTLAAVEGDRAVLFDSERGVRLRTFPHPSPALCAGFSPDGTKLIVGGSGGDIRLWDLEGVRADPVTLAHDPPIVGLSMNLDQTRLVSMHQIADSVFQVVLWSLPDTRKIFVTPASAQGWWIPSLSPSGQRLLLTDMATRAELRETGEGALVANLSGYYVGYPQGFSPDGRWLAGLQDTFNLELLDPERGTPISERVHFGRTGANTEFSRDGALLAVANEQREAGVWATHNGSGGVSRISESGDCVAFSPDGRWMAAGNGGNQGKLYHAGTMRLAGEPMAHEGRVAVVAFDSSGERLLAATDRGEVSVWNTADASSRPLRANAGGAVLRGCFSPDGRMFATLTSGNGLCFWEATTAAPITATINVAAGIPTPWHVPSAVSLSFDPEGRYVVATVGNNVATVWTAGSTNRVWALNHEGPVYSARFSKDGSDLTTISFDHQVRTWDLSGEGRVKKSFQHPGEIVCLDISPDGKRVAAGGFPPAISVWDEATGQLVANARGHTEVVIAIKFSPDGRRFASISKDGTLRVWDADTGFAIDDPVEGLGKLASHLTWSPDGSRIAVAATKGPVVLLDVPLPDKRAPDWLAGLAAAIAGTSGGVSAGPELLRLKQRLSHIPGDGYYEQWARWFFSERSGRNPSPWMQNIR